MRERGERVLAIYNYLLLSSHKILAENLGNKEFLVSENLWDEDGMYFGASGLTKPNKIKGFIRKSYGMVVIICGELRCLLNNTG